MIRWETVVARRLVWLVAASVGGCWTEDPLIYGAFTADQWAHIKQDFKPPQVASSCARLPTNVNCTAAARLGQQLFFEPRLSGPWVEDWQGNQLYPTGKTSCATCHDPGDADRGWYIDTRAQNQLSSGAATTSHSPKPWRATMP